MSEFFTEQQAKRAENSEPQFMSGVAEASLILRYLAEPRPVGDSLKKAYNRASKRVRDYARWPMAPGRVEDLWRQEARRVDSEEMDALRLAARRREEVRALERTTDAIAALRALRDKYASVDPLFFGEQISALEQAIERASRGLSGLGDSTRSGVVAEEVQAEGLTSPDSSAPTEGGR